MTSTLYEQDFYSWTQEQINLLKCGELSDLDVEHLIEEIESMGARERRELIHRLALLMAHLLKWRHQPSLRARSWRLTIQEQRRQLQRLLDDNPSLKARLGEFIADAYTDAVLRAARESGLEESFFPAHCPYVQNDLLDPEFYPA